jgi:hypothetical protein
MPRAQPTDRTSLVRYLDAYSSYGGNQKDPKTAKINGADLGWLMLAARALCVPRPNLSGAVSHPRIVGCRYRYGADQFGTERAFLPFCNCNPSNRMEPECGVTGGWNGLGIRYFVKPCAARA